MAAPSNVPGLRKDQTATEGARKILAARLKDVTRHQQGAARVDPIAVHDMRVAVRRLRAAIEHFGGGKKRSKQLQPLQEALGIVRDHQVHREWLKTKNAELPLEPDPTPLLVALEDWNGEVLPVVARWIRHLKLEGALGDPGRRKRFKKDLAKFEDKVRDAGGLRHPKRLHRIRITAKKLRYDGELLALIFGERGLPIWKLADLQAAIGDWVEATRREDLLESKALRAEAKRETKVAAAEAKKQLHRRK